MSSGHLSACTGEIYSKEKGSYVAGLFQNVAKQKNIELKLRKKNNFTKGGMNQNEQI